MGERVGEREREETNLDGGSKAIDCDVVVPGERDRSIEYAR